MTDRSVPPTVSVVVPVFNDEAGVLACLEALRKQTWPTEKLEIVVVDNESKPPLSITETYPFEVRVEVCEKPGSYAARNKGAEVARSDVLAFTDADCVPNSEWIEQGVAALLKGEERHIVGGEVEIAEPAKRSGTALYQHETGFYQRENIWQKGFSATANLFCTREQFRHIGSFDERLLSGGDREWAWRAAKKGFTVIFEGRAIVSTAPRSTLWTAIRQARRTTAGRYYLHKHRMDHRGSEAITPHRSSWDSLRWIITRSQLTWSERIKVLCVAVVIKFAKAVEKMRLWFGIQPERR